MNSFKEFGLPDNILHTLEHMNFTTPTPIQAESIPPALAGKDILGSAQTGTGKTAAFAIPLVNHMITSKTGTALILLPTRELATQVAQSVQSILGKSSKTKIALLIGGAAMGRQIQQLQGKPRIIVGTPGRINDHLNRRSLHLDRTDFLVLDEMDRMLDMGFGIQIDEIMKYLPTDRQTLMFSATLPAKIVQIAGKYLFNPVRIAIGSATAVAEKVRQEVIKTTDIDKYSILMEQLNLHNGTSLIFAKTKFSAQKLADKLAKAGQSAAAIHGNLKQAKRERVISDFRNNKMRILVATDIAARGLDIPHIESVINYDLPQCPEDYIHRIGRTARAGEEGIAINLLTNKDTRKWKAICNLLTPAEVPAIMQDIVPSETDLLLPAEKKKFKMATKVKTTKSKQKKRAPTKTVKTHFNKNAKTFSPAHTRHSQKRQRSF